MFYALLTAEGALDRYPYTLTDMIRGNPQTSFSVPISDATAAEFGVVPVKPADQPAYDHTMNLDRTAVKQSDQWVEKWISTPATPEQITERTNQKAVELRSERDQKLLESDHTQLPDWPGDKAAWSTYRQALRELSDQPGFPWQVKWPDAPEGAR